MDRAQARIAELQLKISELKRELELSAFLNKGVLGDNDERKLRIKELEEENRVLRTAESKLAALEDEQEKWSATLARSEKDVARAQTRAAQHLKSAKGAHDARVQAETEAAKWKAKFEESERKRTVAGDAMWKAKYDEAVAEAAKWRRKCERWRTAHAQSTSLYEDAELDKPEPATTTTTAAKPFSLALPAGPSVNRIRTSASAARASISSSPGRDRELDVKRPRMSQPRTKTHLATPESLIPVRANTDSPATAAVAAALRPTVSPRAIASAVSASAPTTVTRGRKRKEPEAEVADETLGDSGMGGKARVEARSSAKGKEVAASPPNAGAAFFSALAGEEAREGAEDTPIAKRGRPRKSTKATEEMSTPKATSGPAQRRASTNTREETRTPTAGTRPPPRARVQLSEDVDEKDEKNEESDSDPLDRWDD